LEIAPLQATVDHDGLVLVTGLNEAKHPDIADAMGGQSISMTGLRLKETDTSQVVLRANSMMKYALI